MLCTLGPIKIYFNFGNERAQVRKDHQGKRSGIYCLINLYNFGMYVGQSQNLLTRFNNYLNPSYLNNPKNNGMPISQALLKYGPQGFALLIIEYTSVIQLDLREIFWIDLLQPYYNVLSGGLTSRGYRHTDAAKAKMSKMATGRKHATATRGLISQTSTGANNGFFGKAHSLATLLTLTFVNSAGSVYLYDAFGTLLFVFPSATTFAKLIGSTHGSILKLISSGDMLRGG